MVHYEVGGIGTGQILVKDLIFGWTYVDGLNGLDPIPLKVVHKHDKRVYEMIINGLPQYLQAEVREATKVDPEPEPEPTPEPEPEPEPRPWQRSDGIPRGYQKDIEDEDVIPILKKWGGNPKSWNKFSDFCERILAHPHPAAELIRIQKEHDEGSGWTDDILCCAWMNRQTGSEASTAS